MATSEPRSYRQTSKSVQRFPVPRTSYLSTGFFQSAGNDCFHSNFPYFSVLPQPSYFSLLPLTSSLSLPLAAATNDLCLLRQSGRCGFALHSRPMGPVLSSQAYKKEKEKHYPLSLSVSLGHKKYQQLNCFIGIS